MEKKARAGTPMRRWHRNILLIFMFILFALLILMSPPSWKPSAEHPIPSAKLERHCTVITDRQGVPHIKASSQEALLYCWGKI